MSATGMEFEVDSICGRGRAGVVRGDDDEAVAGVVAVTMGVRTGV